MPTSTLLHFLSLFVNRIHRVHVFIREMLWHATHHCCCHACLLFLCWNVHFRCATELRSCSFVSANVDCFVFFYWLADSCVSFVWHSFVRGERERERESLIMSGRACFSNSINGDLIRTSSCQKHYRVLIYPTAASHADCLLNWYVGSGTHRKGGNHAFFVQQ